MNLTDGGKLSQKSSPCIDGECTPFELRHGRRLPPSPLRTYPEYRSFPEIKRIEQNVTIPDSHSHDRRRCAHCVNLPGTTAVRSQRRLRRR